MSDKRIFSGERSHELWSYINRIDNLSTGDDIQEVFYLLGVALQKLEDKINNNSIGEDK